ncbi:hypothetical protein KKG90_09420 [Candidatus Bipolaricaulota bacterium]|nr:hypothetical protein [Candidatus Bipolaricaulota bacterium]
MRLTHKFTVDILLLVGLPTLLLSQFVSCTSLDTIARFGQIWVTPTAQTGSTFRFIMGKISEEAR